MDEYYPLHVAAEYDNYNEVYALLQKVKNINEEDDNGCTPLQRAIQSGGTAIVELLLKSGADADYSAKHFLHPIHLAASFGHLEIIKLLVNKGVPINRLSYENGLPLHWAAQEGHIDIVEYILDKRSEDVDIPTSYGSTSLLLAALYGRKEVVRVLLERNAKNLPDHYNTFPLHVAAEQGHLEITEMLIKNGANLNEKCSFGWTPLHFASVNGHLEIIQLLFDRGAVCKLIGISKGLSVLHNAVQSGNIELVQYFLEKGGDVDFPTKNGYTPLHIAAKCGDLSMVQFLVNQGACVNFKTNPKGFGALYFAARNFFANIVDFLIQKGATFEIKNNGECELLHTILVRFNEVIPKWKLGETAKIVIKYISLRNKNIEPNLPEDYDFETQLTHFWLECIHELDQMDECSLRNTTISLYQLLQSMFDEHRLGLYLRNENLLKKFNNIEHYLQKFPIYANISDFVATRIKTANHRQQCIKQCDLILEQVNPQLPAETRCKIFSYLSITDLNNFIKSIHKCT